LALRRDDEEPKEDGATWRSKARWVFFFPAAVILAGLVALNLWPLTETSLADRLKTATEEEIVAELATPEYWNANTLRILSLTQPQAVADAGIAIAEEITETNANIDLHTEAIVGPGYLRGSAPVGLIRFHMNDNVSAVHIMGPFGRSGGTAYALMLLGLLAAVLAQRGSTAERETFGSYLSRLSVTTFVIVSIYMLMANVLSAPLTGRNVYLLSVASTGDFIEAMSLLLIGLLMLGRPEPSPDEGEANERA
jgi:hypothetical protein